MDHKLKKWIRWLEVVRDEIQRLRIAQHIFWSVQEIIKKNKKIHKPSSFYQYLGDTYVSHSMSGIRRQIKVDQQSISFARLLSEIAETPQLLSREYFKGLYVGSAVADLADSDFDKFSGPGQPYVAAHMVLEDLGALRKAAKKCEEYADKRVAHRDTREVRSPPLFKDGDSCIEMLDKLYVKYHLLFHASWMDTVMPVYQYDWTEIFREAWMPQEFEESNNLMQPTCQERPAADWER